MKSPDSASFTPLRDTLEESERRFRDTGRYWGLERLALKDADPVRYERLFARLRAGLVNARETAMNISASPIVREIGELCFALYTPEGDSIALSTGIIVHVHTSSDAIKYMVRQGYEDNPGIADGDIFANNDPSIGDVHNADVQTIVPIFWDGEVVGWAAGITHVTDIGASLPGSVPIGTTTRFDDGLDLPAMKVGERDTLYRWHVERCRKAVRTPMYWLLDEKTRITGCHMIRDAVQKVIGEEGLETYRCFIREVIEEGRQAFLRRMKELTVPGTYFVPAFSEVPFKDEPRIPQYAARDTLMHAPFRMEIRPDGELHIGFEGATGWGWHSMNCTPSAIQGAVWVLLSQTIIPNDKVNDGAYLATRARLPKGTWTNPDVTFVSTSVSWFFLIPAFTGMFLGLSRAFFARGFLEEVVAGYGLTANLFHGGGIDHYGQLSAATNFDMSCVGGGAGAAKDGLDFGAAMWNPEGDMGDVEVWELIEPFLYLGRRVKANTAGPGKFRGGSGFESLRMAWKNGPYEVQNMNAGRMFAASGLFGGYPAASSYRHNLHRTDLVESAHRGRPYPVRDGDPEASEMTALAKGEREFDKHTITLPRLYEPGDLYLSVLNGAPGFGDPLEREPARVAADVQGGVLLARYAERVYGVALRPCSTGGWEVDVEATERRRMALREKRRRRAVPAAEWVRTERERILRRDLIEPVQQMYRESMSLSEGWAGTYREFWSLPEGFTF